MRKVPFIVLLAFYLSNSLRGIRTLSTADYGGCLGMAGGSSVTNFCGVLRLTQV